MAILTHPARAAAEDLARALDPDLPRSELVRLAAHPSMRVRAAVASRVDAPMASLISLAHETDIRVREALVANPAAPQWVVRTLATDDRPEIRDRALARLRVIGTAA
jgi:hypothetical protein